jgi:heme exporter protein D
MAEFLDMGGYAATVWPSYGIAAVILIGLLVFSLRQVAMRKAQLDALEAERERSRTS